MRNCPERSLDPPEPPPDRECWQCEGSGQIPCPECDGSGCEECNRGGIAVCWECNGEGKLTGEYTQAEKDLAEDAREDALEAKANLRRERAAQGRGEDE